MNKITSTFGSASFRIVGGRGSSTANQLTGDMATKARVRKCLNHVSNSRRKFQQQIVELRRSGSRKGYPRVGRMIMRSQKEIDALKARAQTTASK